MNDSQEEVIEVWYFHKNKKSNIKLLQLNPTYIAWRNGNIELITEEKIKEVDKLQKYILQF